MNFNLKLMNGIVYACELAHKGVASCLRSQTFEKKLVYEELKVMMGRKSLRVGEGCQKRLVYFDLNERKGKPFLISSFVTLVVVKIG